MNSSSAYGNGNNKVAMHLRISVVAMATWLLSTLVKMHVNLKSATLFELVCIFTWVLCRCYAYFSAEFFFEQIWIFSNKHLFEPFFGRTEKNRKYPNSISIFVTDGKSSSWLSIWVRRDWERWTVSTNKLVLGKFQISFPIE